MNILLADDDPVSCTVMQEFLTKAGHQVEVSGNGRGALRRLLDEDAPQLALLDWMMPDLSGLEVCQQLTRNEVIDDRYVIILSSRNRKKDVAEGLFAGASDYLIKPVDMTELIARVRVAERSLAAHNELRRHAGQLENLVRRHNLLGELAVRKAVNPLSRSNRPQGIPHSPHGDGKALVGGKLANLHAVLVFGETLRATFEGLDMEVSLEAPENAHKPALPEPPLVAAWTPLILPEKELWLDILLEVPVEGAERLARKLMGPGPGRQSTRVPFETLSIDAFAECAGMAVSHLRADLSEDTIDSHAPTLTRAGQVEIPLLPRRPESRLCLQLLVDQQPVTVSVFEYHAPPIAKSLLELVELDTLAEPLCNRFEPDLPLLPAWEALDGSRLNQARRWIQEGVTPDHFTVIQPSPSAREIAPRLS